MDKANIVAGTKFEVKNRTHTLTRRDSFIVWDFGGDMINSSHHPSDGEEFEIILAPRKKNVVYSYPEVSAKFIALRRISDGNKFETYYVNVLYDTVCI
jgi:hypothetical protein